MKNKIGFLDVWKYYFNAKYIIEKGKKEYFTRGVAIMFAFSFWLVIPIFIISSPILYYKTKKHILNKKRGGKLNRTR